MPHLILEYSRNVSVDGDMTDLLSRLHACVSDTAGIRIDNCKGRAYVADDFLVGSGGPDKAFVHLGIRFLEGRSSEVKQRVGQRSLAILLAWFGPANDAFDLQLTVEVGDIERACYFKHPEGTLSPMPT